MEKIKKLVFNLITFTVNKADNKNSTKFLAAFSFLESIIIPIPTDIFIIPMMLTKRYSWLYLGIFVTTFSILGGITGYIIGMYFWDVIGVKIVSFYDGQENINYIKSLFSKYGWVVILIAGFSPIPYKIFTLGSGMLGYNFLFFLICSVVSRGLRFISLSFLVHKYGEKSIKLLNNHFSKFTALISIIFLIIVILLFL